VMRRPLMQPQATPNPKPKATARIGGTPLESIDAEITAENAAVDPTDRSIPPVMITRVIPIAKQALIEDCWRMLTRLASVRNVGVKKENMTHISRRPSRVPDSRRPNFNLRGDAALSGEIVMAEFML
jgi:hypothetical protein